MVINCGGLGGEGVGGQAPEKLLVVLGVAWQTQSHFNPKVACFRSNKDAPEARSVF